MKQKIMIFHVMALISFLCCSVFSEKENSNYNFQGEDSKTRKLISSIIIKKIDFDNAPIPTVVKFLELKCRQQDPKKKGINIIILKGANPGKVKDPKITIDVENIPLEEAIKYICKLTKLKYRIDKHAVIIAYPNVSIDNYTTRTFKIKPSTILNITH